MYILAQNQFSEDCDVSIVAMSGDWVEQLDFRVPGRAFVEYRHPMGIPSRLQGTVAHVYFSCHPKYKSGRGEFVAWIDGQSIEEGSSFMTGVAGILTGIVSEQPCSARWALAFPKNVAEAVTTETEHLREINSCIPDIAG